MSTISERINALTPAQRALLTLQLKKKAAASPRAKTIPRRDSAGEAPLSFAQQRLWFLDQLEPGNLYYNEPLLVVRLDGPLNVAALASSMNEVALRHEILRTNFVAIEGRPVQVIKPEVNLSLSVTELEGVEDEQQAALERLLASEAARQFDLAEGALLRPTLVRLGEQDHLLVLARHHIISDTRSNEVLIRELSILYKAFSQNEPSPLAELPIQYADYAVWQRDRLQGEGLQEQVSYWREQLAGVPPVLELPGDRVRPSVQSFRGAQYIGEMSKELAEQLKEVGQREGATMFMTLLAGFATLLSRYSGQDDLVVGTPIAGRSHLETQDLIGFFANTLALRIDLTGNPTFRQLLNRVRASTLGAYEHQDLPFEMVVEAVQPERDMSRSPLVQIFFVLQNASVETTTELDLTLSLRHIENNTAKFDLNLQMTETENGLTAVLEYNTDLFDRATIARLFTHLETLLAAAAAKPDHPILELPLLAEEERQLVLQQFNQTEREFPREVCLHQLFEQQAARQPNAVAVICGGKEISYEELNRRANQLARQLRRAGVERGEVVGIRMRRSVEMVVGLLGIVKAGGAYLPLDPAYPEERLAMMAEDARVRVILRQESERQAVAEEKQAGGATAVWVSAEGSGSEEEDGGDVESGVRPEDLVYVIYTSGSTGKPKGVMLDHRGRVNNFHDFNERFAVGPGDRLIGLSSPSFDMCAYDVFGTLAAGAGLVLPEAARERDPEHWIQLMLEHKVTIWHSVPALLSMMVEFVAQSPELHPRDLRLALLGGDWIPVSLPDHLREIAGEVEVISLGGATEASMDSTIYPVIETDRNWKSIPYGVPMTNQLAYVLDHRLRPVPIGIPGELHLGGIGVAWGYLNRPDFTAEKFMPNPFSAEVGDRMYKTGDLARYRPDGNLELLGRMDYQVKIRGLRIELGEIEAALRKQPEVEECIVVAREDTPGVKRLVAYVVPSPDSAVSDGGLRDSLKSELPDYMIPAVIVLLEALPLTPNGKVDRKNLPLPEQPRANDEQFEAPRNHVERVLGEIWCKLLGLERVSIHDNFFTLGGDSILSIQVIARASQEGIRLTPKQMFQYQTIAGLAAEAGGTTNTLAQQDAVIGPVPLTPIQHRFFEQNSHGPDSYSHALLLEISPTLDAGVLPRAFQELLSHHDALRLRFVQTETGWRQLNQAPGESLSYALVDLNYLTEGEQRAAMEAKCADLRAGLNLSDGPLMKVAHFDLGPGKPSRMLIIVHQLIFDSASSGILVEDLETACRQLTDGETLRLHPKTTSFKYWAEQLEQYASSEDLQQELTAWLDRRSAPVAQIRLDNPSARNPVSSARTVTLELSVDETEALLQEVSKDYHAQVNELLLTSVAQALEDVYETNSLRLDVADDGRKCGFNGIDLSRTIGSFTSIFPVHLKLIRKAGAAETLRKVKEQLRSPWGGGIGCGVLRYLRPELVAVDKLRKLAPAEIKFSYLGQIDRVALNASISPLTEAPSGPSCNPQAERSYLLEIDAYIAKGRLQVSWTYGEDVHSQATIERLAQVFLQTVRSLIKLSGSAQSIGYTPSDFPLANLDQSQVDRLHALHGPIEDIYPLSPMQQNMIFHTRHNPQPGLYSTQRSFPLAGAVDVAAFERAWQSVVDSHAILRTTFLVDEAERPLQLVHPRLKVEMTQHDWREFSPAAQLERLDSLMLAERARAYDLGAGPLLKMSLIRLEEQLYQFVMINHYLLMDGWTELYLRKEVLSAYLALSMGQQPDLKPSRPYRDYVAWLAEQDLAGAKAFWQQSLEGLSCHAPLASVRKAVAKDDGETSYVKQWIRLSAETTSGLHALAREQQLTINTLVQGAWALLLQRYSGEQDIVFGLTSSGRPASLASVETMVGLFINTIPVRVKFSEETSFVQWLKALQTQQAEARQYEYASLQQIGEWNGLVPDQLLFDSILVFDNYPVDASLRQMSETINVSHPVAHKEYGLAQTEFPVRVDVWAGQELSLFISYYRSQFDEATIKEMLDHLKLLLESIAEGRPQLLEGVQC